MFQSTASQIGAVIMTLVCLFTGWTGARPQRDIAIIAFVAWIASAAIQDRSFRNPQYATFVLDAVLLAIFLGYALRWRRGWLNWVAALQSLTMATHIAAMMDRRIWPMASITAYMVWSYLTLAVIAWGGVEALLARRRARAAL
jgi:hypothetical protein